VTRNIRFVKEHKAELEQMKNQQRRLAPIHCGSWPDVNPNGQGH
jgi:hypothetical protein